MKDSGTFRPRSEKEIFFEALDKNTPEERAAFLDGACGSNPVQRTKVEALLADHFQRDAFMQQPALPREGPTPELAPAPEEAPPQMLGRYKLLEKIGEGGFGEVWMAEQREPVKRRVALKIIKLGMDSRQIVGRFEAERQALAMMDHANIAKIFDAGVTDTGRSYFVMELVRGVRITDYCDQNQLPTQDRLKLFILVCQAIQHAHQKGIIHRDIKPSNILVTLHDGAPVPKVIDFGIAKATQQELTDKTVFTQFQQFIGTPAYISPEQAEMSGLDIDTRADIYSLGVLLYELLVGHTPLDAAEMMRGGLDALRQMIRGKEPLRPSTKLNTLPGEARASAAKRRQTEVGKLVRQLEGDLDWIVMKCLEKDRTRRYETANGLAADLKRHLNNEPVVARSPSMAYRLQKAFLRNKVIFAAGTAVAASLVLGLCVSLWLLSKESQARSEQSKSHQVAQNALAEEAKQHRMADLSAEELSAQLYASEMTAAFGAFSGGSIQRSRELLDRQNDPDKKGRRGFEWRWLWGQTRPTEQLVLTVAEDPGAVTSIDFSPDGRRFLTFDLGGLKIWDTATHEVLSSNRHKGGYHAEFSRDGKFIVSLDTWGREVRLWDGKTGGLLTNLIGHTQVVVSATFSPDGRLLASTGSAPYDKRDAEIFLWDLPSRERVAVLGAPGTEFIFHPRFSPDGQTLAAGCGNGHILLWDVPTRRVVGRLTGHQGGVMGVAFTPDGTRLVSSGLDRTVRLWDVGELKEISLLGLHENRIWRCAVSPDGRWAATTGFDHLVKVWKLDPPGLFRTFRGHLARATGVVFHPDGATLATAGLDGTVRFWNVSMTPDEWVLDGVYGRSFGFASKNRLLLGLLAEGRLDIWDVAARRRLFHVRGENAVWAPNSERTVFHRGLELIELDVGSKSEEVLGRAGESEDGRTAISCSADGRLFAWGHGDHAHVFDRSSRLEVARLNTGEKCAEQIAFSPDGATLATVGDGSSVIQLWQTAAWQVVKLLEGHRMGIKAVRFSPDGRELASSSMDRTSRLWRLSTGEQWILQDDEGEPRTLAFSPDGRTLAIGTFESSVKLWNVATRQQIASLQAGASVVHSVNFSPDGLALSSVTMDGKVRVWQAPSWAEVDASEEKKKRNRQVGAGH